MYHEMFLLGSSQSWGQTLVNVSDTVLFTLNPESFYCKTSTKLLVFCCSLLTASPPYLTNNLLCSIWMLSLHLDTMILLAVEVKVKEFSSSVRQYLSQLERDFCPANLDSILSRVAALSIGGSNQCTLYSTPTTEPAK